MRARSWLIYGALVGLAVALGLANQGAPPVSRIPSVDNPGPAGLKAIAVFLAERGFTVRRIDARFTSAPADLRTLVIAAPVEREIDRDEVAILRAFVQGGGRLVYLAPRPFDRVQPAMARWLQLYPAGFLRPDDFSTRLVDVAGSTAAVWTPPLGAPDVQRLRVGAGGAIASSAPSAVPAAGGLSGAAALVWGEGSGEIWVFAGAEIAENRRLEMEDNLALWEAFAADGPIGFDEWHHTRAAAPGLPPALLAIAGQLLFATVAYALSRGIRLGPPRPEPVERHRSILEYVASMAWLIRRARVEPELAGSLAAHLRHRMRDLSGVPVTASDEEAAVELELRTGIPRERTASALATLRAVAASPRASPHQYLRCARIAAELERDLTGGSRGRGRR